MIKSMLLLILGLVLNILPHFTDKVKLIQKCQDLMCSFMDIYLSLLYPLTLIILLYLYTKIELLKSGTVDI